MAENLEKINDDELENIAGGGRKHALYGVYCKECKKFIADYGSIGPYGVSTIIMDHKSQTGHTAEGVYKPGF